MSKFLITGGAGFIGSNYLLEMVDKYKDDTFVCVDALTYCGNLNNLKPIMNRPNFKFIKEDITHKEKMFELFKDEHFDYVINFAAESDVDRSLNDPTLFFNTNVYGTGVLLEASRLYGIKKFHQISTDEVYGDIEREDNETSFKENSKLNPRNPYSASKAAADLLVLAYKHTYNLNISISRSSNNYGPYQYEEKLIPLVIKHALSNKKVPVYGDGLNMRDWLYVRDNCEAIDKIVRSNINGEIFNICGKQERTNLYVIKQILSYLNKKEDLIEYVKTRPNDDKRYVLDTTKIEAKLGFKPKAIFEESLIETINWYLNNPEFLN